MASAPLQRSVELINAGQAEEGLLLLRQIASQGDPEALFLLADMTWSGTKVPQEPARGRLLFEYAAALGHPRANLVATNLLANGIAGKRNWPAALERLAAEARQLPERQRTLEILERMNLDSEGDPKTDYEAKPLSEAPCARVFEQMMTSDECAYLIEAAEGVGSPGTELEFAL